MLDRAALRRIWPEAPDALIDGVMSQAPLVLKKYGIDTPLRLAHFFGQISHESDGGTITRESLNYTHAERICEVWPRRFSNAAEAAPYVRNERALANKVYGGRMGNRVNTDDGYTYRGRGLLQITGHDSYRDIETATGVDLLSNPDLAFAPSFALSIAAAEFQKLGCLPYCDRDDLREVTLRVNGGTIGLASRAFWLARWKPVLADGKIAGLGPMPAPAPIPAPVPMPPDVPAPEPTPQHVPDQWWLVAIKVLLNLALGIFRKK